MNSSALRDSNLSADFINGFPLSDLFTLHTKQTFKHGIKINGTVAVKEPLIIHGHVNGLNLQHEFENTVMVRIIL